MLCPFMLLWNHVSPTGLAFLGGERLCSCYLAILILRPITLQWLINVYRVNGLLGCEWQRVHMRQNGFKPVGNVRNLKSLHPTLGTRATRVLQSFCQERFGNGLLRAVQWAQRREGGWRCFPNSEGAGRKRAHGWRFRRKGLQESHPL